MNYEWILIGIILLFILFNGYTIINKKFAYKRALRYVKARWLEGAYRKRDIKYIKSQYELIKGVKKNQFGMDDQTWGDMDLDQLYEKIDLTYTECGQVGLYKLLRTMLTSIKGVKKRTQQINYFIKDKELREKVSALLFLVSNGDHSYLLSLLDNKVLLNEAYRFPIYFMPFAVVFSIVSIPFTGFGGILFLIIAVIFNSYLISKVYVNLVANQSTMSYIRSLLVQAGELGKLESPYFAKEFKRLKELNKICQPIIKKTKGLTMTENDPLGLATYLNALFLVEARSLYASYKLINKHKEDIREVYEIVGRLDAIIAVANYKHKKPTIVEPVFYEAEHAKRKIELEEVVHPLLKKPVANSISIDEKGVLLTGSNMSGKSTFLRSVALNIILAQTVGFCWCKSYKGSIFKVMSSITRKDDMDDGKSYFLVEAELILNILNQTDDEVPSFILIDEIFRGTNTIERIEASSNILKYLAERNALVMVATHDLEIKESLENGYDQYFFSEKVSEEGLEFDYKLKKGVVAGGNAIKILEYLGYPSEITKK